MDQCATRSSGHWLRLGNRVRIARGATRQAILHPALSAARLSRQRFARPIAWFLSRSVIIVVERIRAGGFTWPLLPTNIIAPLIVINASVLDRSGVELARILLHEGAHQCGVVWPEWRNWVNTLSRWAAVLCRTVLFFIKWNTPVRPVFPHERIYGIGVNAADNVAFEIISDAQERGWRL